MIFTATVYNKDINGNAIPFETMLRKFKKKTLAEGVIQEVKSREYFLTRSEKRRLKAKKHQRELLRKSK